MKGKATKPTTTKAAAVTAPKKKSSNKLVDGLSSFLAAFKEVESRLKDEYGEESEDEISSGLITELASAAETIIDSEDYSSAFIASAASTLTDALKELDPDIFEYTEEDEEDEDEDEEEDDDDTDLDEDDYYEDR